VPSGPVSETQPRWQRTRRVWPLPAEYQPSERAIPAGDGHAGEPRGNLAITTRSKQQQQQQQQQQQLARQTDLPLRRVELDELFAHLHRPDARRAQLHIRAHEGAVEDAVAPLPAG
jgi:hypothetical protein